MFLKLKVQITGINKINNILYIINYNVHLKKT